MEASFRMLAHVQGAVQNADIHVLAVLIACAMRQEEHESKRARERERTRAREHESTRASHEQFWF